MDDKEPSIVEMNLYYRCGDCKAGCPADAGIFKTANSFLVSK